MAWSYNRCYGPGSGPHPTAEALARWMADADPGGRSGGIFNPRKVRGSSSWSVHACGRALDWFPRDDAMGWRLAYIITDYPDGAGVQMVLWKDYQWGGRHGPRWTYTGRRDHDDHLHIEIRG